MKILNCMIFMMDNTIEEKLIQKLRAFNSIEISEIAKTSVDLIEKLNRKKPSILFFNLDNKEIPFSNVVKLIQKPPFIIGITNNKKQLQEYLDQGIFDFLDTKIEIEALCQKITKIWNICNCLVPQKSLQANEAGVTYTARSRQKSKHHMFVRYKKMNVKIVFDDILFIRNTGNCLRIESTNNKIFYHDSTLKKFITELPAENFIRLNKSVVVNLNRIERIEKDTVFIKNNSFKISRIFAARLKDILTRFK